MGTRLRAEGMEVSIHDAAVHEAAQPTHCRLTQICGCCQHGTRLVHPTLQRVKVPLGRLLSMTPAVQAATLHA